MNETQRKFLDGSWCSGCGTRWVPDGIVVPGVVQLCGDCWRKVQAVLHAPAETVGEPTQVNREEVGRIKRQVYTVLAAMLANPKSLCRSWIHEIANAAECVLPPASPEASALSPQCYGNGDDDQSPAAKGGSNGRAGVGASRGRRDRGGGSFGEGDMAQQTDRQRVPDDQIADWLGQLTPEWGIFGLADSDRITTEQFRELLMELQQSRMLTTALRESPAGEDAGPVPPTFTPEEAEAILRSIRPLDALNTATNLRIRRPPKTTPPIDPVTINVAELQMPTFTVKQIEDAADFVECYWSNHHELPAMLRDYARLVEERSRTR